MGKNRSNRNYLQKVEDMVEHLHIQILPLNLLHGSAEFKMYVIQGYKGLSQMKILSYH